MKFSHPLMHNNFSRADINSAIKLLNKKDTVLTQSKYVKEFEKKWSKWLGVKYSIFVNSGSSANLLTINSTPYVLGILQSRTRRIRKRGVRGTGPILL